MTENKQTLFTVSIDKEFDVLSKEYSDTIYLRLYSSLFRSNIIKELKPTAFTVLLAVASFMDAKGNCYPTQRQIADITGLSLPTINKAISTLLEYKINDKPILERKLVRNGKFENSYYTINPISHIAIGDDSEINMFKNFKPNNNLNNNTNSDIKLNNFKHEDKKVKHEEDNSTSSETVITNTKQVIDYFCKKYREVYNEGYTSNFGRDAGLIKNKIIGNFSSEQIKTMIDVAIEEYENRWKNERFKRPTISALCTWLGNEALAIAKDREKEMKEIEELQADSDSVNKSVLDKFNL